jgi:hypothetical protein
MYPSFKTSVLGRIIGDGQCVALVVNNSGAYIEHLYPGVNWTTIITPVPDARLMAGKGNSYLQWVANDHNNPNQVPPQGAIMIFDATPQAGYTNQTQNPAGHTGICDSADANGYTLLQQNSPSYGSPVNLKQYPWKFRPCMGWYIPLHAGSTPVPNPAPTPTGKTIFLPPTTGPWHLYNDNGPYVPSAAKGLLVPSQYGGLTYAIQADKGNGVYVINTQMFGQGALWTKGSAVVIK